jgi:hypothetical protein
MANQQSNRTKMSPSKVKRGSRWENAHFESGSDPNVRSLRRKERDPFGKPRAGCFARLAEILRCAKNACSG